MTVSSATFAQTKKVEVKTGAVEKKQMCEKQSCCSHISNLSDEQKQKIEKLEVANQKELLQLTNLLQEKKSHLNTLETADNADLVAINTTIDDIVLSKGVIMKKEAAFKQDIRKILTEAQRLQFDLHNDNKGMKGQKHSMSPKHDVKK